MENNPLLEPWKEKLKHHNISFQENENCLEVSFKEPEEEDDWGNKKKNDRPSLNLKIFITDQGVVEANFDGFIIKTDGADPLYAFTHFLSEKKQFFPSF